MTPPRFVSVELHYGVHARSFELSATGRPIVVAGPNGSGKSTLLEGVVRTLFGFHRGSSTEREAMDARRPWGGGGFEGTVVLETSGTRLAVRRRFESDQVTVAEGNPGRTVFEGEARAAGRGETHQEYRRLLGERFGLHDLDDYERTAYVRQGDLAATRVGEELLRIAAGGHAAVKAALPRIEDEYYALTREPIREGVRGKQDARRRERLLAAIRECEGRLAEARAAEARRRPLLEAAAGAREALERADAEISLLEAALPRLARRQALEGREETARLRHRALRAAAAELAGALRHREEAGREREEAAALGLYPEDFETRAGALETLWGERERRRAEREEARRAISVSAPGWAGAAAGGGLAVGAAGGAVWILAGPSPGAFLVALGSVAAGAGLLRLARAGGTRRAAAERLARLEDELRENERALRSRLEGVPEAGTLTPDTLPDRLRIFRRQRAAGERLAAAERELREAAARARGTLGSKASRAAAPERVEAGERLAREATRLQAALSEAEGEATVRLAEIRARLAQESSEPRELPPGVTPATPEVEAALRHRRRERRRREEEALARQVEAATRGRPPESPLALETRLAELRGELEEVEGEIRARREAYVLLADAYEEFRGQDQARLLAAISAHLEELSGGELGPLHTAAGLEEARLRAFGRDLPLDSPPLSFGELHAALLAVRLGAVDFLAGAGIQLPLLVDEPFAHLDPSRAGEVWRLLRRVARERQVIVATQDLLVLERLRVEPDIRLPEPAQAEFDFGPPDAVSPDPSSGPA